MAHSTQIATLIRRASQAIERRAAKQVRDLKMTYRQIVIVVAVQQMPGCSQKDITNATSIDRSTVNTIVERLIARGILKQTRSRMDKRTTRVSCTAEGERKAAVGRDILLSYNADLHHIAKPDNEAMERALSRLIAEEEEA